MGRTLATANRLDKTLQLSKKYHCSAGRALAQGECRAATHVPPGVRDQHAAIPWRQILATRNRLIHGFLGIDNDTLWSIISDDIEPLIAQLDAMLGSP